MVYSSFYFLELNKYNITRNIDLKYFLSRVEARMLWFVLPRVKKKRKIMEDRSFTELFPSKNWHQLPPSKQLTSCIHTFIVATLN